MVTIQSSGIDAIDLDLREFPGASTRAGIRAINRGMNSGRTLMVRSMAQDTGMRSTDVRDALRLQEATLARPSASLAASLKRMPLIKFVSTSQIQRVGSGRRPRGGVTVKLPGSKGRYPNAFIAQMASGHTGVFQRKGKARLPIRELFGPSLGHVFAKFKGPVKARIVEVFEQNFDHEMQFRNAEQFAEIRSQVGLDV